MKIKAVCEYTGLTDRAVRFYVEKGLLAPESVMLNDRTYYEYSDEDVELLKAIVILRRSGFFIEEILRMQKNPQEIEAILKQRGNELSKEAIHIKELAERLEETGRKRPGGFADVYELAEEIRHVEMLEGENEAGQKKAVRKLPELKLEFGKYDPETEEEKEQMYQEFLGHQYVKNKMREPFERFGKRLKHLIPACIRAPLGRFFKRLGWGTGKIVAAFLGVVAVILLVLGLFMMIPRSLSDFFPWEEMDGKKIWVNYGRWEWSVSTNSNYKNDSGTYLVGTEGYVRLENLLETTKCSGFVQSLFPRNGYVVSGSQESIMLDVMWEKDGQWEWKTLNIYDNGILFEHTANGSKIYYMDWFGRKDCDRFFEEVKNILEECESEENGNEQTEE